MVSHVLVNSPRSPLTRAGMNDVLPKPFTKDGLLDMLEKHLGHLKKMPEGLDHIPQHAPSSINQSSTGQSLKDENSPAESPSTISNWQSPSQYGVSPTQAAAPSQFLQSMHPPGAYSQEHSPVTYQSPHTPVGGPPRQPIQHRRQISEIGGDDLSSESKRQRIYDQHLVMGQMGRPQ